MATIKDVARLAGVSQSTASRALSGRGYASPETYQRVSDAAKELDYATVLLKPGEKFSGGLPLPVKFDSVISDAHGSAASYTTYQLQGVVSARLLSPREQSGQDFGYAQGRGTGVLDAATLTNISDKLVQNGEAYMLDWTAPADGNYALFVYWMHGTGQTASPSVSTNYTINYIDKYGIEALIDYWEEIVLTEELKDAIRKSGRGEIYMDSLELTTFGAGGLFWGYHIKREFKDRMGYDITKYLPLITTDGVRITSERAKQYDYMASGDEWTARAEKIRMDYYSVISDMYVENVLAPLQKWLHSLNMTLRAEPSYGMPYEISTPARCIDTIETESFAQAADLDLYRGMLGSANMYGRIFSSETGAVEGKNYYYSMDEWTQLCYLQFAGGVNRTVFHGYSAIEGSVEDTYWPGHEGMYARFSERWGSRQPASLHYPAWTEMLGRNQKALRQGRAVRDIAVLRTDYAFINYGQPKDRNTFTNNLFMHDIPYFWNDLSLQRAGYTYDYFSPLLLEDEENVSWSSRELQPKGPAYRAIIVYQESIELSAAEKLYTIVRDGIPLLFVNNNTEIAFHDGTKNAHGKAASVTKHLGDSTERLCELIAEIKALPNVIEVDSPAEALPALERLGVHPRAAYDRPNSKIMTMSRRDDENGVMYVFVYSYKFEIERDAEPFGFTLNLEGEGIPYHIDDWTGAVNPEAVYRIENGKTCIDMTLIPGESRLIALDLDSPKLKDPKALLGSGKTAGSEARLPEEISIPIWDISIEDWNQGERIINTEEKFGHVTKEAYFTTKKTVLSFKDSPLLPWKDLPASPEMLSSLAGDAPSMSHVSGIGTYTSSFTLPEDWNGDNGAYLCIDCAGGGTVEAYVNGVKTPGINTRTLRVDISPLLKKGRNDIRIEVASTLTNRMLQRGYKDKGSLWTDAFPAVQACGLSGRVRIVPIRLPPCSPRVFFPHSS